MVQPVGLEHHSSSAVTKVPYGVQAAPSQRTCCPGAGLNHSVSVPPWRRSVRWMPDWPLSNGVKR